MEKVEAKKDHRQKEVEYEFFGPYLGPIALIIGLPALCYALVYICNSDGCISITDGPAGWKKLPGFPDGVKLFSWEACGVFLAWLLFQIGLHLMLPGPRVQGVRLGDGTRLTYKLTGERNFWVSIALLLYFGFYRNILDLSWAYMNYIPLMTASIAFSFLLSAYLYLKSFAKGAMLAHGGNTGIFVYDFFMGRELNPRIRDFDLKEFCELYPGLIGWIALDLAMLHYQWTSTGTVSASLVLVCIFQGVYVWDGLHHERSILTTIDITTDGFGFMLSFGDLAWVPFTYSLQARILAHASPSLSFAAIVSLIALKLIGYVTFRGANSQKDTFRRDPSHPRVAHLKTMPTERGTKLIMSGWWGIARHINYFGDWLMGLAWCLPAGFQSGLIPYFYVIYFGALLIHRDRRDESACRLKYGKDWDKYCQQVPYRFIPYIY